MGMNFIVGVMNSGTSLIGSLLAGHKFVNYIHEEYDIIEKKRFLPGGKVSINKVLLHMFPDRTLEEAMDIYAPSKTLFIIRDGRDTALSQYYRGHPDLQRIIYDWNRLVEYSYKLYSSQPHRFTVIRYEDLVLDTEIVLKCACEFFGVSYDKNLIKFFKMYPREAYNYKTYGDKIVNNRIGVYKNHPNQEFVLKVYDSIKPNLIRSGYEGTFYDDNRVGQ